MSERASTRTKRAAHEGDHGRSVTREALRFHPKSSPSLERGSSSRRAQRDEG